MLTASRIAVYRRPIWQQSSHHIHVRRRAVRRSNRLQRVSRPPPSATAHESTGGLLLLLATMCGVQAYASPVTGSFESAGFVARNFETTRGHVLRGYVHTLFTSTLYTPDARSALLNVLWLGISGRHVCRAVGNARFLALFVGSGALANAVILMTRSNERKGAVMPLALSVGGSACAVDCIVTLNALLYPPSRVALSRRWIRWPLWFFSAMFLTRDEGVRPPWVQDCAPREGHLTGVLCGLAAFLALRRPPRCFCWFVAERTNLSGYPTSAQHRPFSKRSLRQSY
ncbi:serine protease family [Phytophthora cinnamomi]|uniref:serine protease family n=1 Tax=Phytophthora cinnamomi TaxID=4785 RepID=UPI00355A3227|nr:serine protease family [Phytophthora cinnamomi]